MRLLPRIHDLRGRVADQRGASLVEYALLVALIALVCFAAMTFFGESNSSQLRSSGSSIQNL